MVGSLAQARRDNTFAQEARAAMTIVQDYGDITIANKHRLIGQQALTDSPSAPTMLMSRGNAGALGVSQSEPHLLVSG